MGVKNTSNLRTNYTACGHKMAQRKWKETKQHPSLLPGPAVPGCSLVSFHFLWAILCPQAVHKCVDREWVGKVYTNRVDVICGRHLTEN